jgi:glycosyltransferase involved in cell wall biosynthesis
MRVGIDALNLRADERGMGRYVRRIIRDLAARPDWSITLLVRDPANADAYRAIAGETVTVAPVAAAAQPGTFDAVWYPWNAWRFRSAAPAVLTLNDDFAFRFPARGPVARFREQVPIRRGVRSATRVATISRWSRREIAKRFRYKKNEIAIVPLAPDPFFSPGDERAPFDEPFVLFVGGAERRKNLSRLMRAFARAFVDGDVRLVIVGDVDAEASYPLTVIPRADDALLRTLYRTARAVAVPSLAEGFGLVVAEAQACGAAVAAADAGAVREAGGDAALLVDPLHVGGWSAALTDLVYDEDCNARLRAAARKRWLQVDRDGATVAIATLLVGIAGAPTA